MPAQMGGNDWQVQRYQRVQNCLPHVLDLANLEVTAKQVDVIFQMMPCLQALPVCWQSHFVCQRQKALLMQDCIECL